MAAQTAELYRMAIDGHICPFGLKSKDLLERKGFAVREHKLLTREDIEAFKARHGVETTPQTFINGERIGGFSDLQQHFNVSGTASKDGVTYQPIISIFAVCAFMAMALSWATFANVFTVRAFEWFIAISMCVLAIQKLRDLEAFSNQFITYDFIGMRWIRYAYIYPFAEALAGGLMIAGGALIWIAAPVALLIGSVGAISVIKAVYIDKRDLRCACVGGNSNVPLGFISLTENIMMVAVALWMFSTQILQI